MARKSKRRDDDEELEAEELEAAAPADEDEGFDPDAEAPVVEDEGFDPEEEPALEPEEPADADRAAEEEEEEEEDWNRPPRPRTPVFTIVLLILNFLIAPVFVLLLYFDYTARYQWSYATFLNRVLTYGLPFAEEEDAASAAFSTRPRMRIEP